MMLRGRRIAILGCGYLGQRVAQQALEQGMEVTGLTRNAGQAERLRSMGLHQVVMAELSSFEWHPSIDPRQDFVLNCVSSAGGGSSGYLTSYCGGMKSMLRWMSSGEAEAVAFTSSTSVYGRDDGGWVSEEEPAEGAPEVGRILREAESLLAAGAAVAARWFILRLGGIYGPDRHHLLTRARQSQVQEEEGDETYLNSIHVEDACRAIWSAFGASIPASSGVFNIVDNAPTPKGEIVRWLHRQARARGLLQSPAASPGVRAPARRAADRRNRRVCNRRAAELLGWKPKYPDFRAGYLPLLEALEERRG